MVNNEKVRLMPKLAVYEKEEGREDMRTSNYFRSDYVRHEIIKTILITTVGFLLLLSLVILANLNAIIDNVLKMNYPVVGWTILGAYLILVVFYAVLTGIIYRIRYMYSHGRLARYYRILSRVRRIEEREERQRDEEEEWGE